MLKKKVWGCHYNKIKKGQKATYMKYFGIELRSGRKEIVRRTNFLCGFKRWEISKSDTRMHGPCVCWEVERYKVGRSYSSQKSTPENITMRMVTKKQQQKVGARERRIEK